MSIRVRDGGGLACQLRDTRPVAVAQRVGRGEPGAAGHGDVGQGEEVAQVLRAHAAGGAEAHIGNGRAQGLEHAQAAGLLRGEELHQREALVARAHHLARRHHARNEGQAGGAHGVHQRVGAAGREREARAGVDDARHVAGAGDGAGAQVHLGHGLGHGFDGVERDVGSQGDFHDVDAAFEQGVREGHGLLRVGQHDDGHDARGEGGVAEVLVLHGDEADGGIRQTVGTHPARRR